jgi:hypothetical protein
MNPDQLKPGERAASTSNRNFEGRQGKGGRTHLVSPKWRPRRPSKAISSTSGAGSNMEPFSTHRGIVALLDRSNVDTDAIIPKQFLKSIKRTGFGPSLFFDWRYLADGKDDPRSPERAALQGRVHPGGAQQFRLRLQPRARGVGGGCSTASRPSSRPAARSAAP